MGKDMIKLIERIQKKWKERHGFSPTIVDLTNMIAREIERKGIYLI
ncbi:MAG: hypothetical protein ACOC5T_04040 [Elusimicrobiota bacterium]